MTDPSTGVPFGLPPETLTVELDPSEAAFGTAKHITVPPGFQSPDPRFPGFQQMAVQIPPGVGNNSVLRLPGALPNPAGGPPGDLFVRVVVRAVGGSPYPVGPPGTTSAQPPVPPPPGAPHPQPGPPAQYPPGAALDMGPVVAPPAPGRARKVRFIAVGLAVVLVAGCCGAARLFTDSDGTRSTSSPGTGTTTGRSDGPKRRSVAAEEYQQLLTGLDTALTPGFQQLAAAKSPTVVRDTASGLQTTVKTELGKLAAVNPQGPAQAAHTEFVGALDDLGAALADTSRAAGGKEVCAGSSALSRVTQAPGATRLRTAATTLAGADPAHPYRVGAFLPAATADADRRLDNGALVKKAAKTGSGKLEIKNGGGGDAALSLVLNGTNTPFLTVYVRGGSNHTVSNVRDGDYRVFMASGKDWDSGTKSFTRNCDYQKFDDEFKFTTSGGQFTIWEITLNKVVGGNASASDVDPGAFPTG